MLETEMLMDERTSRRLMISKEDTGAVKLGVFNDATGDSTTITIGRSDVNHLLRSMEEFKNNFVEGSKLGGLELHGQTNQSSSHVGPISLRKHGTGFNYYTFNSGVYIDSRELAYEFQDKSFYYPELTDIEVLIEWMTKYIN